MSTKKQATPLTLKALKAIKAGKTIEALNLYLKASEKLGKLFFKANIEICARRLGIRNSNNQITHTSEIPCQPLESINKNDIQEIARIAIKLNIPDIFHFCSELLFKIDKDQRLGLETAFIGTCRSDLNALSRLDEIREPLHYAYNPKGPLLYIIHQSLPFTHNGYSSRADGILSGLQESGINAVCITRPGFPRDIIKGLPTTTPMKSIINGQEYIHLEEPLRNGPNRSKSYIIDSASTILNYIEEIRPCAVIAASNYVTALPSLLAAKLAGVPAAYEVRGFWEITEISNGRFSETSFPYHFKRYIESQTAMRFDKIFTLSNSMRNELATRGVNSTIIDIAPNGFNANQLLAQERNKEILANLNIPSTACIVGYAGSIVEYEGLVDLASACVQLICSDSLDIYLIIVGEEKPNKCGEKPITTEIQEIFEHHSCLDRLKMPGRVDKNNIPAWYSTFDICPFPRRPELVCELVTPLKPIEAMAMGKAVIVSSCAALQEQVKHNETGIVVPKGDNYSLAKAIKLLASDKLLRARLGFKASEQIRAEQTWKKVTDPFKEWLSSLTS